MNQLKNVIITGATGFIGQYLAEKLIEKNVEVFALIRNESKTRLRCEESKLLHVIKYAPENLTQLETDLPKIQYDACFNLAWGGVAGAERQNYRLQLGNIEHTLDLMHLLSQYGCKRFIGASSVSEYECALFMPVDEARVGGRFVYSAAKQASHYMNKCLSQAWNIPYINACIANTYGEYGLDSLILHDTIITLLKNEETAFSDCTQYYDFLYVKDVVDGLIAIAQNGRDYCSYYVGSNSPKPLKYYIQTIGDCIAPHTELGFGKRPSDGMNLPKEVFDNSKLREHTGFSPIYDYENTITKVIDWYKKRLTL